MLNSLSVEVAGQSCKAGNKETKKVCSPCILFIFHPNIHVSRLYAYHSHIVNNVSWGFGSSEISNLDGT